MINSGRFKKGYHSKSEFQKGHIPWHKDRKNVYSIDVLKQKSKTSKKLWQRPEIKVKILGRKNSNYKGGITPIRRIIGEHQKRDEWRKVIFKRDNYKCVKCNKKSSELHADHYPIPFSVLLKRFLKIYGKTNVYENSLKYKPFWDIENGRTLCRKCHLKTETYGNKKIHKY